MAINTVGDELEEAAAFSKSEKIGLEVTDFAFPWILDEEDLKNRIDRNKKAVAGISPLISHGPCFDLAVASRDRAIVSVARDRHNKAFNATREIGASFYIGHTNFNPLIRDPSYAKKWQERTLNFWLPYADTAGKSNITICLENLWEPVPDIQAELIQAANHPHLRATFDNGHVLVFSDIPSVKWVETLGPMLAHCHLHDNSGEYDEHKPIGEGKENWPELIAALSRHSPRAILVTENDSLNYNKISFGRLKNYWSNLSEADSGRV